jgi:hypothetical protein
MRYRVVTSAHQGLLGIRICPVHLNIHTVLTALDEDRVALGSARNNLTVKMPAMAYLDLAANASQAIQFAGERRCETFLAGNPVYGVMIRVVYRCVDVTIAGSIGHTRLTHAEFIYLGYKPQFALNAARLARTTAKVPPARQLAA